MQRTLVTGASGFLGAHVVGAAVARARGEATLADPYGPPVFALSRSDPMLAPRFCEPREAAQWIRGDLTEPLMHEWLLDEVKPTEIVHCAALSRAADCESDSVAAEILNVFVPEAIARWARAKGARLVHVSTDLVFGDEDAPPGGFTEEASPGPLSVYGKTKHEGELAIRAACPDAAIVRLPLLYGNSAGRGLGASDSLIDAVHRGERPSLFVDEWRTPLEVSAAAQALVELLDFEGGGLIHVAGPDRTTRHELGLAVLEAMGLSPDDASSQVLQAHQADIDAGAARPRDVSLNTERARSLLETALPGVRNGLERAIAP